MPEVRYSRIFYSNQNGAVIQYAPSGQISSGLIHLDLMEAFPEDGDIIKAFLLGGRRRKWGFGTLLDELGRENAEMVVTGNATLTCGDSLCN